MMFRTGSTGTEVTMAFMLYEDVVSPMYLDGFGLLYKVLGVSGMRGEIPTRGQRMFAISLAPLYIIEPLLDTIGHRGLFFFWILGKP